MKFWFSGRSRDPDSQTNTGNVSYWIRGAPAPISAISSSSPASGGGSRYWIRGESQDPNAQSNAPNVRYWLGGLVRGLIIPTGSPPVSSTIPAPPRPLFAEPREWFPLTMNRRRFAPVSAPVVTGDDMVVSILF